MPNSNKQFHIVAEVSKAGENKGEVMIYSAIDTYDWGKDDPTVTSNKFDKALKALGDVSEITIRINSPGGVVSEAIAIRTMLMKHKAKKTVDIEGCCDSAATLIACMPGVKVRIAQGGEYMIHKCSAFAWGNANKMLSTYNSMTQTDKDMADIYSERTGMDKETILELMNAETWYGANEAIDAGFADEIISDEDDVEIAACAVDAEAWALMQEKYAHAPKRIIRADGKKEPEAADNVSNEAKAVAALDSAENTQKGERKMPELKDATAEQLRTENPELVQEIAETAVAKERERVNRIDKLTPKGAKWEALARQAKADGLSAEAFFEQIIAEQAKTGEEYLSNREKETQAAKNVGGGDPKDADDKDKEAEAEKAAKEIAELSKGMSADGFSMA